MALEEPIPRHPRGSIVLEPKRRNPRGQASLGRPGFPIETPSHRTATGGYQSRVASSTDLAGPLRLAEAATACHISETEPFGPLWAIPMMAAQGAGFRMPPFGWAAMAVGADPAAPPIFSQRRSRLRGSLISDTEHTGQYTGGIGDRYILLNRTMKKLLCFDTNLEGRILIEKRKIPLENRERLLRNQLTMRQGVDGFDFELIRPPEKICQSTAVVGGYL